MIRRLTVVVLAAALQAIPAAAADPYDTVIDSPHNVFARSEFPIGRRVCLGCHAEGTAPGAPAIPAPVDEAGVPAEEAAPPPPLWQRDARAYAVSRPSQPGVASTSDASNACLGCHDGVLGQEIHRTVTRDAKAFDHPTNVVYPRRPNGQFVPERPMVNQYRYWSIPDLRDGSLVEPTGPTSRLLTMSAPTDTAYPVSHMVRTSQGMVQCDSCHDPHDNGSAPFLRAPSQDLCFICHDR
jgi:predicted CXXCH cytochrome family protein